MTGAWKSYMSRAEMHPAADVLMMNRHRVVERIQEEKLFPTPRLVLRNLLLGGSDNVFRAEAELLQQLLNGMLPFRFENHHGNEPKATAVRGFRGVRSALLRSPQPSKTWFRHLLIVLTVALFALSVDYLVSAMRRASC